MPSIRNMSRKELQQANKTPLNQAALPWLRPEGPVIPTLHVLELARWAIEAGVAYNLGYSQELVDDFLYLMDFRTPEAVLRLLEGQDGEGLVAEDLEAADDREEAARLLLERIEYVAT